MGELRDPGHPARHAVHTCPAAGCTERVPNLLLACRRHWYALPVELRRRVWTAWVGRDLDAHGDAVAEAIAFWHDAAS